jgi:hypothetical protein
MFARDVIGSDGFADMGFEAQALYIHLSMDADDWGFVGAPKRVQRSIGSKPAAMEELAKAGFVHMFGVLVIMDWWQNNTITESRRKATQYEAELASLTVTDCGSYQLVCEPLANCTQTASKPREDACETPASLVEVSLGEVSLGEVSRGKGKPARHAYGEYSNVMLSDEELEKLKNEFPSDWAERIEQVSTYCASKGKSYKNYLATIRSWARRDDKRKGAARDATVFDAIGAALGA